MVAQSHQHNDGPTKWLSDFLEKNKNLPPEDWSGHRNIDQKEKAPEILFFNENLEDEDGQD